MARIRYVKPDFFRHEGLYQLEQETKLPIRLGFEGLWIAADKAGRFKWRPAALKLDALPYDDLDFEEIMDALAAHGFIVRYVVDGEEYGYIPSWEEHQRCHKTEAESRLPDPKNPNTRELTVKQPLLNVSRESKSGDGDGVLSIEKGNGEGESEGKPSATRSAKLAGEFFGLSLPPGLDFPEFRNAWASWVKHRAEIRHALTKQSVAKQIAKLAREPTLAVAIIEQSILNGWQGLFELKPAKNGQPEVHPPPDKPKPVLTPEMLAISRKAEEEDRVAAEITARRQAEQQARNAAVN